jgi:hypothetical protein
MLASDIHLDGGSECEGESIRKTLHVFLLSRRI